MEIGETDDGGGNQRVQEDRTKKILAGRAGGLFFSRPFGLRSYGLIPNFVEWVIFREAASRC